MRKALLALAIVLGIALVTPAPVSLAPAAGGPAVVAAASLQAQPDLKIDVDVNKGAARAWYVSPVWLAIGGLAVLILLLIVVFAARGSGTTIVKD